LALALALALVLLNIVLESTYAFEALHYIGIERTEEYCAISARRLTEAAGGMGEGKAGQMGLLDPKVTA